MRTPIVALGVLAIALLIAPSGLAAGGQARGGAPQIDWNAKTPWGTPPNIPNEAKKTPFKIFDNVYYVGPQAVSSFIIVTSDGLVLLDATFAETADAVLDNVRAMGFDPKQIKYIFVTHGHADHYAGAGRLKQETGARVGLSAPDWEMVERQQARGNPNTGLPLPRDLVLEDGQHLKVGDTEFVFYVTPGHTPGALSIEYRAREGSSTYRVLMPGGVGMNFGPDITPVFLKTMERLKALGPWDSMLPNHPPIAPIKLFELEKQLAARKAGDANPAVFGSDRINQWFDAAIAVVLEKQRLEQAQASK